MNAHPGMVKFVTWLLNHSLQAGVLVILVLLVQWICRGRLASRSVQLAVYRLAWARLKGVPLETVSAAFYYVPDDAVVRPHDLGSEAQLEAIIKEALSRPGQ